MAKSDALYDHKRSPKRGGAQEAKRGDTEVDESGEEWVSHGKDFELDKDGTPTRLRRKGGEIWTPRKNSKTEDAVPTS